MKAFVNRQCLHHTCHADVCLSRKRIKIQYTFYVFKNIFDHDILINLLSIMPRRPLHKYYIRSDQYLVLFSFSVYFWIFIVSLNWHLDFGCPPSKKNLVKKKHPHNLNECLEELNWHTFRIFQFFHFLNVSLYCLLSTQKYCEYFFILILVNLTSCQHWSRCVQKGLCFEPPLFLFILVV